MILIGEHWEGDVRVRWWGDPVTHEVHVERSQDAQDAVDLVAAINAEGAPINDGLGVAVAEIPITVAIDFCQARGIPWEKFMYSNEYDSEFKLFCKEYSRLAYQAKKTVHTVQ